MENPHRSRILAGTVDHTEQLRQFFLTGTVSNEGPTVEQSVPEGLYPMQRAHSGAVCEEPQPVGTTCTGVAGEGQYPEGGAPTMDQGEV